MSQTVLGYRHAGGPYENRALALLRFFRSQTESFNPKTEVSMSFRNTSDLWR